MTRIPKPTVRRALRATQLALGAWLVFSVLHLLLAPAAAADNCSVFTDCFGVANSAVEAAFGLSLLAVISLVLDFVPVAGTGKGLVEAATGRDLLTGEELAAWERALGVLPLVGGLTALKYADDVAGLGRRADVPGGAGRQADDIGGVARLADGAGGARRPAGGLGAAGRHGDVPTGAWDAGVGRALDPSNRSLVDDYVAGTTSQRRLLAEQLGERGGLQYLRETTGRDIGILRPATDADVADLRGLVDAGEPWPRAVAFGGGRATNLVYFDGRKLIVIEAKGGGGGYGDRVASVVTDTNRADGRIAQTHPEYPFDVAADMKRSPLADGRDEVGAVVQRGYFDEVVEYVGVRTGGYGALSAGNPRVVLEHVFLAPGQP